MAERDVPRRLRREFWTQVLIFNVALFALAVGVMGGVVLWLLGMIVGWGVFAIGLVSAESLSLGIPVDSESMARTLRALVRPAAVLLSGGVFGAVGFGLGFGTLVAVPYSRASSRRSTCCCRTRCRSCTRCRSGG